MTPPPPSPPEPSPTRRNSSGPDTPRNPYSAASYIAPYQSRAGCADQGRLGTTRAFHDRHDHGRLRPRSARPGPRCVRRHRPFAAGAERRQIADRVIAVPAYSTRSSRRTVRISSRCHPPTGGIRTAPRRCSARLTLAISSRASSSRSDVATVGRLSDEDATVADPPWRHVTGRRRAGRRRPGPRPRRCHRVRRPGRPPAAEQMQREARSRGRRPRPQPPRR